MDSSPLISAAELLSLMGDPALRIVDVRFDLMQAGWGREQYAAGHIPGAVYAHLGEHLSDASQKARHGRHPLPAAQAFRAFLSQADLAPQRRIVVYDQEHSMYAARLWWLLRHSGYADVRVLDGGWRAWCEAGGARSLDRPASAAEPVQATLDRGAWVDTESLQRGLAEGTLRLIDARAAPRFRGEVEPIDPVAGHVPGACNRPYTENLQADGRFLPPTVLREAFTALSGAAAPATVVHMCGSGVTGCHNLLAMEVAGLSGSKLYADSWSGWILDPARPVATGP